MFILYRRVVINKQINVIELMFSFRRAITISWIRKDNIDHVKTLINTMEKWYAEGEDFANKVSASDNIKRTCKRHWHCENPEFSTNNKYFKRAITIACLDDVLEEMKALFNLESLKISKGFYCLPKVIKSAK